MQSARIFLKNTLLLTSGGILMRGLELGFRAFLAASTGAENMGIYGLVMSAYMVFATLSISGIRFSVTRLCAEAVGKFNPYPLKLMRSAFLYCAFFGLLSGSCMYIFSDAIASTWIAVPQTSAAVRILALTLPFIAIQSSIGGYFTGKEKVMRLVAVQLCNSIIKIALTVAGLSMAPQRYFCTVMAAGEAVGEVFATLLLLILYIADTCGKREKSTNGKEMRRILKTALPLAVSAYTRTGLSSLGHMLVPFGLRKSGIGKSGAFTAYGIIHEMAFPVIFFPTVLLSSLGEILTVRLTHAQSQRRKAGIIYMANRTLRLALLFSAGIAGLMHFCADELSIFFYKTADAGQYIRLFSFLIPIMYLDSVTDGCLKGLGQQLHSMLFNIADALLNVILLYTLLPVHGIKGYIMTVFICEIMNFVLSIRRLRCVTVIDIKASVIITAAFSAAAAHLTAGCFPLSGVIFKSMTFTLLYIGFIYILNAVSRDDIQWLKRLCTEKNA